VTTRHVDPTLSITCSSASSFTGVVATSASGPDFHPSGLPTSIPHAQAYYWTRLWQEGEAEALRELAAGAAATFEDGTAAIRWLLDDEDAQ
jgi:hypothetical protein